MTPLTSPTLCSGLKAKLVIRNKIHHRSGSCAPSSKLISTRKLVPGTMHVPGVQQLRVLTSTRYYCCTYSPEEVLVAAAVLEKIPETGSPRVVLVFRAPLCSTKSLPFAYLLMPGTLRRLWTQRSTKRRGSRVHLKMEVSAGEGDTTHVYALYIVRRTTAVCSTCVATICPPCDFRTPLSCSRTLS